MRLIKALFLAMIIGAFGCQAKPTQADNMPEQKANNRQEAGFAKPKEHPIAARLITEHTSIAKGGKTRVGVLFKIKEGWHIYAQQPGDAGLPTKVIWTMLRPAGTDLSDFTWPQPQHFTDPGNIQTSGYTDKLVLIATLSASQDLQATEIPLTVHAEWLACRDICLPGKAELSSSLPVGDSAQFLSPDAALLVANP